METVYNKLVRDNIPAIIIAEGRKPVVRVLNNVEYLDALNKKLLEEINGYISDNCFDELCDILEVAYAIAKAKGYSDDDIESHRNNKSAKNGAFEKKFYLERIITEESE